MKKLSLYVHWPYCRSKCPYCDFNSHVMPYNEAKYLEAMRRDLFNAPHLEEREISTIFFGGGTPSLMSPSLVGKILANIAALWPIAADAEISLEANPTSTMGNKLTSLREIGVNRLSIGVQSLSAAGLQYLGRKHNVKEALDAVDLAKKIFPRVSMDLIYGWPGHTLANWEKELRQVIGMVEHLSLYQLTIEENTEFAKQTAMGEMVMPSPDLQRQFFDLTRDITAAVGLHQYEVSNFCTARNECRHNLSYWLSFDYLGFGPGAHGRYTVNNERFALSSEREPRLWMEDSCVDQSRLTGESWGEEYVMMGMRLSQGIDLRRYQAITGKQLKERDLDYLVSLGLLQRIEPYSVAATYEGFAFIDSLIKQMLLP